MSEEFNITARGDSREELLEEIEVQAEGQRESLPEAVRQIVKDLVEGLPAPNGGYFQLTAYGSFSQGEASNLVLNLSSHASAV